MHPRLVHVEDLAQLDRLLKSSDPQPLLLFKHSRTCGTSAEALDELIAHLDERRRQDTDYAVVTVQTHREISNAVSAKLGIRHETPQALLIRDRRVVWSASHFRVTADAVTKALEQHLAAGL